ncbi:MAG: 2-hydroxycyclohexanecarboxyl-CoA dehydrogenase [Mycobacterium sp.]|nr:2-hydroxycyclohexanecarboxyl-CoA dehydrogenase [Mycobacterium sp.]
MATARQGERVALVAGSGGRVGSTIVSRLRAEGFAVGGLDEEPGAADLAISVDLTDRAATTAAAERVANELGPIAVLVTAPEHYDAARFGEMSPERWRRLLSAHLGTTTNACAAVVPGMVEAGRGTVVTLSSWLALAGIPGESYFAAATGSILAFTKSFALEVAASGVRVNCIAVGPLHETSRTPVHITPDDVADSVMFLVEDGDFFVGQVLSPAAGTVV